MVSNLLAVDEEDEDLAAVLGEIDPSLRRFVWRPSTYVVT